MLDKFREIEKGHEARYKLDEELRFKVRARATKRLAAWAAEQLALSPAAADAYASQMIMVGLEPAGAAGVHEKIRNDLTAVGVAVDEATIRAEDEACLAEAMDQLTTEYPQPLGPDHEQVGG